MIYEGLFTLIVALRPEEHVILINTNATLLDEALAKKLKRCGVDFLNISVDEMHAVAVCGKGIDYRRCDELIHITRKAGLSLQFNYVLTHENLANGEFEKFLNYCFKQHVLLIGNLPIPLGRWQNKQDIVLSAEQSKFLRCLEKNTPYFRTDHKSNIKSFGCPAFQEKLYVTPYGDILGCTFLQFSIGNVKNEPLADILKRRRRIPYFTYPAVCPPAEDSDFIDKYGEALSRSSRYPLELDEFLENMDW